MACLVPHLDAELWIRAYELVVKFPCECLAIYWTPSGIHARENMTLKSLAPCFRHAGDVLRLAAP